MLKRCTIFELLKRCLVASLVVGLLGLGALVHPSAVWAGATVYYSPSSIGGHPGDKVTTTIYVNAPQKVSALDITATFPADLLGGATVSTAGTAFPVVLFQPQINNSAGTIHLVQTSISGYQGGSGLVATITLTAKKTGSGRLSFSSGSKVVEYGPSGKNVYSGSGSATVSITTASTPSSPTSQTTQTTQTPSQTQQTFRPVATSAPTISSSTHPDQENWYKSRSVTITWTGGGQGYNYTFDQSSTTQLGESSKTTDATATTTLSEDGVWYAHVKTLGSDGWSATSHYRLQLDATPPEAFTPTVSPDGEITVLPTISFKAKDAMSGIAGYRLRLDGGDWRKVSSPYKVPEVSSGSHTVEIEAADKAGNTRIGKAEFAIKPLAAPVITSPDNDALLMLGQQVQITGKAEPKVTVKLQLTNKALQTKKTQTLKTNDNGTFATKDQLLLFAGAYQVVATAENSDGIHSRQSQPVKFTIDPRAVAVMGTVIPGWLFFSVLGTVLAVLLLVIGWLAVRVWILGRAWKRRVGAMRGRLGGDLQQLEQEVSQTIESQLGKDNPAGQVIEQELVQSVDRLEQEVGAVGDEMLKPEPWLPGGVPPILHGKARFGLEPIGQAVSAATGAAAGAAASGLGVLQQALEHVAEKEQTHVALSTAGSIPPMTSQQPATGASRLAEEPQSETGMVEPNEQSVAGVTASVATEPLVASQAPATAPIAEAAPLASAPAAPSVDPTFDVSPRATEPSNPAPIDNQTMTQQAGPQPTAQPAPSQVAEPMARPSVPEGSVEGQSDMPNESKPIDLLAPKVEETNN